MRHCLILFCIFFTYSIAAAQTGSLSGRVTDQHGDKLAGATLSLKGLNKSVAADEEGRYTISNVPYGSHQLEIRSLVSTRKSIQVNINQPQQVLNISLNEKDNIALNEVSVQGKTEKRKIEERGFAVNVIETKGMDLQTIQTNELLDRSAGVRIRQNGGMGSQIQYNINGLSGNAVRILLDGVPISNYGEAFSLNSIPVALIERIEVYKGVIPAHLADDALGGAINVVLKKAMKNSLSTSYSFGSFNTHQWNMSGNYRDEQSKFTARASAFYNYTDNSYEVWGEKVYITDDNFKKIPVRARRFNDGYQSAGGNTSFGFTNLKWADQLMLGVLYAKMDKEVQNGANMEAVYGERKYNQETKLLNLDYSKRNLLVQGLDFSLFASFSNLERNTVDTVANNFDWNGNRVVIQGVPYYHSSGAQLGAKTLQQDIDKKYASRANLSYALNENHKIAGTFLFDKFTRDQDDPMRSSFERELTDTRQLTKSILSLSYELTAFEEKLKASLFYKYYNLQVSLKDPIATSNGVGQPATYTQIVINRHKETDGYGLALSYALHPKVMLTASAEEAVRLPDSRELFGNNAEGINPAYQLNPEQSKNANLGVNVGPFTLDQHSIGANFNVFSRDVKGMIMRGVPTQQSETFSYENLDNVISKGFDVELRYRFKNDLHLTLNASIFNARFNTQFKPNGATYDYYGSRLRNEPYFTHNSNIRYDRKDLLQKNSSTSFNYNLAYVHQFYRTWELYGGSNVPVIPTQVVQDFGFTHTFPNRRYVVSFDAKNIFDKQVFDNWALQKAGRAFYVKINYIIQ